MTLPESAGIKAEVRQWREEDGQGGLKKQLGRTAARAGGKGERGSRPEMCPPAQLAGLGSSAAMGTHLAAVEMLLPGLRRLGRGPLALELRLQEEAAELVEAFQREQGEDDFTFFSPIVISTARVIGALVFSRHFLSEDPFFQELIQTVNFGLAFVGTIWCRLSWSSRRQLNDLFPWAFCCLPGPYQEMFRYQKAVWGYIHRELSRHKLRTSEAPKDFISYYLAQIIKAGLKGLQRARDLERLSPPPTHQATDDPVSTFNEENLIQVVVDLFLEGAQRLSSGVTVGAVRQCVTSTRVHGHPVPKFNPGHFLDKDGNFVVREVFLPFSAGHQVCLGDQLARMKLLLMFAILLRTFSFQLPGRSPGLRLEYNFGGTRQPQPQKIYAVPRLNCPHPGPREEVL
ncbi:hypothetical protein G4228_012308 [Cervus hanglu yarkandensis]|nr:hypothetical protein G4228_012308 [Cervus hanglu yarkandensis]